MTECPFCVELLSNPRSHLPTPELIGPGDRAVYWCIETKRHAVVPIPWTVEVREILAALRETLLFVVWR